MVAKSYQKLELKSEPYVEKGRMYVKVQMLNGSIKQVRWYTDFEYAKLYPEDRPAASPKRFRTQAEVLGFGPETEGFITIFKGDTYEEKDFLKELGCTYTKHWGWGLAYDKPLNADDLPEGITPVRLNWTSVGNEDGTLKSDSEVTKAVEELIYDPSSSEFQGNVGDKVDIYVTVKRKADIESYYGVSHMHEFEDDNGNIYVWFTQSQNWEEGTKVHIKGTIKELKVFRNTKQTILTRCRKVA